MLTDNGLSVTYLDHDHREGENIRFLAIRPLLVQDFGRSPSCGIIVIIRGAPDGVQVLSDHNETKIRDPCAASGVHKDVRLDTCQHAGKVGLGTITYSLEITVNYVAGVEKAKAIGDVK